MYVYKYVSTSEINSFIHSSNSRVRLGVVDNTPACGPGGLGWILGWCKQSHNKYYLQCAYSVQTKDEDTIQAKPQDGLQAIWF